MDIQKGRTAVCWDSVLVRPCRAVCCLLRLDSSKRSPRATTGCWVPGRPASQGPGTCAASEATYSCVCERRTARLLMGTRSGRWEKQRRAGTHTVRCGIDGRRLGLPGRAPEGARAGWGALGRVSVGRDQLQAGRGHEAAARRDDRAPGAQARRQAHRPRAPARRCGCWSCLTARTRASATT